MFRQAFPVVATCLTLIASTTPVQAQQVAGSFDELRMHLKAGDTVTVTDMSGQTIRGKVSQLSASSLELVNDSVHRTFTEPDVITIRHRRHNSVKGGAMSGFKIGGLVGGVLGTLVGMSFEINPFAVAAGGALYFGGIGAGIGAGISALKRHDETVFARSGPAPRRLTISPIVTEKRRGVQMSWAF